MVGLRDESEALPCPERDPACEKTRLILMAQMRAGTGQPYDFTHIGLARTLREVAETRAAAPEGRDPFWNPGHVRG